MRMGLKLLAAVAAICMAFATVPAHAQSPGYVQLGTLVCKGKGGIGFIIASKKTFLCEFKQQGRPTETYGGSIVNIGIDLGFTGETTLIWAVFASSNKVKKGDLAGTYVGAGANASIAIGVGANALVGGNNNTIALQPFSAQGQAGLNVAVGVQDLTLVAR